MHLYKYLSLTEIKLVIHMHSKRSYFWRYTKDSLPNWCTAFKRTLKPSPKKPFTVSEKERDLPFLRSTSRLHRHAHVHTCSFSSPCFSQNSKNWSRETTFKKRYFFCLTNFQRELSFSRQIFHCLFNLVSFCKLHRSAVTSSFRQFHHWYLRVRLFYYTPCCFL